MRPRARERTGRGPGGVRLVEVAGKGALDCVRALAERSSRLVPGALVVVPLRAGGGAPEGSDELRSLDEVLVHVADRERVELGLHGGPAVVARVLAELERAGAARAGDTPRRTLEEDARARLATAASEPAARILLDQTEGALRRGLGELARADGGRFDELARALEQRARWFEHAARPRHVVIAGPANAGKSTLFNLLAGRERVVVSPTPGTTRDAIREPVRLGAWPIELWDTAGERAAAVDSLERSGQALARSERERADLCLWLDPDGRGPADVQASSERVVVVVASRAGVVRRDGREVAIASLEDPEGTVGAVAGAFRTRLGLPEDPWEPGAPVPFRPEHLEWVERLRALRAGERPAELDRLLERPFAR